MRWKLKSKPVHGDLRIIEKFLVFPTCIDREWRWLERVKIVQQYIDCWGEIGWCNYEWFDK